MSFDVNTLSIVGSIVNLAQVIALFIQWRLDRSRSGPGWWLLGTSAVGLAYILTYLRSFPPWVAVSIVGNNLLFVSYPAFVYVGILRFFHLRERRGPLFTFLAAFTLADIYLAYVNDNLLVRQVVFSVSEGLLFFLAGRAANRSKTLSVTVPAYLLATVMLTYSAVLVLDTFVDLFLYRDASIFGPTVTLAVNLFGALVVTTLNAFGFILLMNQRMNAEYRRAQERLREQATTDDLTGIANRRYFIERAAQELKRALRHHRPLAVALIDLDHFKQINDTFGHAAGDQALIAFTQICRKSIREIDVFARFGGDEFVLLLPETNSEQARVVAERIHLALIKKPIDLSGQPASLTISAGIASLNHEDGSASMDALLAQADKGLYLAKERGRNRVQVQFTQLSN